MKTALQYLLERALLTDLSPDVRVVIKYVLDTWCEILTGLKWLKKNTSDLLP
jgi:hypothetical protein